VSTLPGWVVVGAAAAVLLTVLSLGALLEHRRWAVPPELGRITATSALLAAALLL
jgi:hypothetical protein